MTNLRKSLTGQEVKERLDISSLDLCELVESRKLTAIDLNTGKKAFPVQPSSCFLPSSLNGPFIDITADGIQFIDIEPDTIAILPKDLDKCFFSVDDVKTLEADRNKKKSAPQKKWGEVRKIAKEKWGKNSNITIEDMAQCDDITLCLGKNLTIKYIRNKIKDLCPNPRPGRPPVPK